MKGRMSGILLGNISNGKMVAILCLVWKNCEQKTMVLGFMSVVTHVTGHISLSPWKLRLYTLMREWFLCGSWGY